MLVSFLSDCQCLFTVFWLSYLNTTVGSHADCLLVQCSELKTLDLTDLWHNMNPLAVIQLLCLSLL